jgi:hypothetical protein
MDEYMKKDINVHIKKQVFTIFSTNKDLLNKSNLQ